MANCPIMQRMKDNYESVTNYQLVKRMPTIIRIDGKSFHSYVKKKGYTKPFDSNLMMYMRLTALHLCEQIQNVVAAYIFSDEISLLLVDYQSLTSQQWFGGKVQKIASVSASIASAYFNYINPGALAYFDSRVFNVPVSDVNNYFIARQRDCVKNSINSVAQTLYSHSELQKMNNNARQEMIFKRGINWNDYTPFEKRGTFIMKNSNGRFIVIDDTPDFQKNQDIINTLI